MPKPTPFRKYHALGNDYLVIAPEDFGGELSPADVRVICHRNFGIGSDGILWGPSARSDARFGLRIFNPDGSEAEKSGNGLRIFSRYLWDRGLVDDQPFSIHTPGGLVRATVQQQGRLVQVEMGTASFDSRKIPVAGPPRDVLDEPLAVGDREFRFCAVTVGNPHCVLPLPAVDEALARRYGPLIETEARFANRTNVQFMQVLDRANIRIEIWERGAGYTLASGSSASAASAAARRLGLVDGKVAVHMPGGVLDIELDDAFGILMTGPVTSVAEGVLNPELFTTKI